MIIAMALFGMVGGVMGWLGANANRPLAALLCAFLFAALPVLPSAFAAAGIKPHRIAIWVFAICAMMGIALFYEIFILENGPLPVLIDMRSSASKERNPHPTAIMRGPSYVTRQW